MTDSQLPPDWFLISGAPNTDVARSYEAGTTRDAASGKTVLYVRSRRPSPEGDAVLGRRLPADRFRGSPVGLRASVRTESAGRAGLWVRVNGPDGALESDTMSDRAVTGTTDWTPYSVEVEVPLEAETVDVGVWLAGSGTVVVDGVVLEGAGSEPLEVY